MIKIYPLAYTITRYFCNIGKMPKPYDTIGLCGLFRLIIFSGVPNANTTQIRKSYNLSSKNINGSL